MPKFGVLAQGVRAAALVATVLVALSGCSFLAADTSAAKPTLPEKNLEAWVLPLDQYTVTDTVLSEGQYAENLLIQPCMEKAGFSWNVPARDPAAGQGPSWNAAGRRLFTADLAKKWGYHLAPAITSIAESTFATEANHIDAQEQAVFNDCLAEARKKLPSTMPFLNAASGLGVAGSADAANEPEVRSAAGKWRACMLPLGISDLPTSPQEMPSASLASEFGLAGQDQPESVPTAREREVAVADLNCRTTSGYRQLSYDAEWERQLPVLQKNADELNRIASAIADYEHAALAVIASHAPKG
jgi:hypothetical protein